MPEQLPNIEPVAIALQTGRDETPRVAGLDAGQRHGAQPGSLSVLAVGQMLAAQAATGASDDKAAYARIKQAVQPLHSLAKPQLLEVAQ